MSRLDSLPLAESRGVTGDCSLSAHVLAINAGGAATVKTTGAIVTRINGITRSKSALSAQSIAVTHDYMGRSGGAYVQPDGTTVYYVLGVNAAGTVAVVQGSYLGQSYAVQPTASLGTLSTGGTQPTGSGAIPDQPAGYAPFGLIKVVTSGATFTPGTTALDASGVTATFFDIGVIPAGKP